MFSTNPALNNLPQFVRGLTMYTEWNRPKPVLQLTLINECSKAAKNLKFEMAKMASEHFPRNSTFSPLSSGNGIERDKSST
jgi:hypothetical protein